MQVRPPVTRAMQSLGPDAEVRVVPTLDLETELAVPGVDYVVGLDEVGRGALAGPVMVGAFALPVCGLADLAVPDGLADSKALTPRRRRIMYDILLEWGAGWAVGACSNAEIDRWGIGPALGLAALRALDDLEGRLGEGRAEEDPCDGDRQDAHPGGSRHPGPRPGADRVPPVLAAILDGPVDYVTPALGSCGAPSLLSAPAVTCRIKGDSTCASVSAASVMAKVTRDSLMVDLVRAHPRFAPYGWERNKGYGSREHKAAIAALGPTTLHRTSWHLSP